MARLLGIVLPLGLGAAVSPTLLAMQLVTLSRKTAPLPRSWALAAGCAVVLAAFAVLALLVAKSTGGSNSPSEAGAIVKWVAAALLVVIGLRQLRKQPAPPRLEHAAKHPLRGAFLVGAALMLVNFSSIVLFFSSIVLSSPASCCSSPASCCSSRRCTRSAAPTSGLVGRSSPSCCWTRSHCCPPSAHRSSSRWAARARSTIWSASTASSAIIRGQSARASASCSRRCSPWREVLL